MDVIISVNFWFILCLCLISLVAGMILGGKIGRDRYRY